MFQLRSSKRFLPTKDSASDEAGRQRKASGELASVGWSWSKPVRHPRAPSLRGPFIRRYRVPIGVTITALTGVTEIVVLCFQHLWNFGEQLYQLSFTKNPTRCG